jgi:hypothetical protein
MHELTLMPTSIAFLMRTSSFFIVSIPFGGSGGGGIGGGGGPAVSNMKSWFPAPWHGYM